MSKNILIMNWRDPQSPLEGGAERFTAKYAEYWHKRGHTVYWLTNSFSDCQSRETIQGVQYIRLGPALNGSLFSYIVLYPLYLLKTILFTSQFVKEKNIDLVIDEIHGLPFFTPLYVRQKIVLLVCEVAGPIWDKMFPFPINWFGKKLEKIIYQFYKNVDIWSISKNTQKNIQEFLPQKKVDIIDLGFEYDKKTIEKSRIVQKTKYPSVVFLARLVPMKGIEAALLSLPKIVEKHPNFVFSIMGRGQEEYERHLKEIVSKNALEKNVHFLGHLDGIEKYKLLASAHYLLHPSYKEGFGLTLIEAGIVGTPALIRTGSSMDALVTDGQNGFVFENDAQISETILKALSTKKYTELTKNSIKRAEHYSWDKVLKRSESVTQL